MNNKITVLIADDNSEFSATLAGYIKSEEDLELIGIAKDGIEAYDLIKNTEPDVVLLDVIMPRLDGLGVLEKIILSSSLEKGEKRIKRRQSAVCFPGHDMQTRRRDQRF